MRQVTVAPWAHKKGAESEPFNRAITFRSSGMR
jgi:hypothetical protein